MINANPQIGLARRAVITKVNYGQGTVKVRLYASSANVGAPLEYTVPISSAWIGNDGGFVGGAPKEGNQVLVEQATGGEWFIVAQIPPNNITNINTNSSISPNNNLLEALQPGRWLSQTANGVRIFGDPDIGIQAGSSKHFLHINPIKNIISHNFDQQLEFTEAHREIKGDIGRYISYNSNINILSSTSDSQSFDDILHTICLDPSSAPSISTSGSFIRNPPLSEIHEIAYEFAESYGFTDDINEADKYENSNLSVKSFINRRDSRADALSLSLVYPNHIIETIKGTVVDVYGNILDLNREVLPIGKLDKLSLSSSVDKSETFNNIREQLRKSIAYHFELNARKDVQIPDITDSSDYGRDRSRLSVDIDKEGQFKINIPASSEVGNIPLLARYENFTTLHAAESGVNPNELQMGVDKKDIYLDGFSSYPKIKLITGEDGLDGYAAPIDRFTKHAMLFGTAFHDITNTINARYIADCCNPYDTGNLLESLPQYKPIVNNSITVSGDNANAGGRSGSLHLDGFLNLSIGANTIDRQSLWFDYAGGVVGNIGRDRNNISYAVSLDGDLILTVGGKTVGNDSRFNNPDGVLPAPNNAARSGAIDIRVLDENNVQTIVRIDSKGVSIATPGRLNISAGQNIVLKSNADIILDGKNIVCFGGSVGRAIQRNGQSI